MNPKVYRNQAKLMNASNRKKLYKKGKQWIVASSLFLSLLAGGSLLGVHADSVQPQAKTNVQTNNQKPTTQSQAPKQTVQPNVSNQASVLHNQLVHQSTLPAKPNTNAVNNTYHQGLGKINTINKNTNQKLGRTFGVINQSHGLSKIGNVGKQASNQLVKQSNQKQISDNVAFYDANTINKILVNPVFKKVGISGTTCNLTNNDIPNGYNFDGKTSFTFGNFNSDANDDRMNSVHRIPLTPANNNNIDLKENPVDISGNVYLHTPNHSDVVLPFDFQSQTNQSVDVLNYTDPKPSNLKFNNKGNITADGTPEGYINLLANKYGYNLQSNNGYTPDSTKSSKYSDYSFQIKPSDAQVFQNGTRIMNKRVDLYFTPANASEKVIYTYDGKTEGSDTETDTQGNIHAAGTSSKQGFNNGVKAGYYIPKGTTFKFNDKNTAYVPVLPEPASENIQFTTTNNKGSQTSLSATDSRTSVTYYGNNVSATDAGNTSMPASHINPDDIPQGYHIDNLKQNIEFNNSDAKVQLDPNTATDTIIYENKNGQIIGSNTNTGNTQSGASLQITSANGAFPNGYVLSSGATSTFAYDGGTHVVQLSGSSVANNSKFDVDIYADNNLLSGSTSSVTLSNVGDSITLDPIKFAPSTNYLPINNDELTTVTMTPSGLSTNGETLNSGAIDFKYNSINTGTNTKAPNLITVNYVDQTGQIVKIGKVSKAAGETTDILSDVTTPAGYNLGNITETIPDEKDQKLSIKDNKLDVTADNSPHTITINITGETGSQIASANSAANSSANSTADSLASSLAKDAANSASAIISGASSAVASANSALKSAEAAAKKDSANSSSESADQSNEASASSAYSYESSAMSSAQSASTSASNSANSDSKAITSLQSEINGLNQSLANAQKSEGSDKNLASESADQSKASSYSNAAKSASSALSSAKSNYSSASSADSSANDVINGLSSAANSASTAANNDKNNSSASSVLASLNSEISSLNNRITSEDANKGKSAGITSGDSLADSLAASAKAASSLASYESSSAKSASSSANAAFNSASSAQSSASNAENTANGKYINDVKHHNSAAANSDSNSASSESSALNSANSASTSAKSASNSANSASTSTNSASTTASNEANSAESTAKDMDNATANSRFTYNPDTYVTIIEKDNGKTVNAYASLVDESSQQTGTTFTIKPSDLAPSTDYTPDNSNQNIVGKMTNNGIDLLPSTETFVYDKNNTTVTGQKGQSDIPMINQAGNKVATPATYIGAKNEPLSTVDNKIPAGYELDLTQDYHFNSDGHLVHKTGTNSNGQPTYSDTTQVNVIGKAVNGKANVILNYVVRDNQGKIVSQNGKDADDAQIVINGRVGDQIKINPWQYTKNNYGIPNNESESITIPSDAVSQKYDYGQQYDPTFNLEYDAEQAAPIEVQYVDEDSKTPIKLKSDYISDIKGIVGDAVYLGDSNLGITNENGHYNVLDIPKGYYLPGNYVRVILAPASIDQQTHKVRPVVLTVNLHLGHTNEQQAIDTINFNGDPVANTDEIGSYGETGSIEAPVGYHFTNGSNGTFTFSNQTHNFDVEPNDPTRTDNNVVNYNLPNGASMKSFINTINGTNNGKNNTLNSATPTGNGQSIVNNIHTPKANNNEAITKIAKHLKQGQSIVVNTKNGKLTINSKRTNTHYRWLYVIKSILLHRNIDAIGSKRDAIKAIKPKHKFYARIIGIYKLMGHGRNFTRYEISVKIGKYYRHVFVTGNPEFVKNAYYQLANLHHAKKFHHKYYKARIIAPAFEYKGRFYTRRTRQHLMRVGKTVHISRIVRIGRKGDKQTKFELTNGNYITANKNFIKLI